MSYLISPDQILKAAMQEGKQLQLSCVAVLTFSRVVIERLEELCSQ